MNFLESIINEIQNGLFYFSGPWDFVSAFLDIAVTTFIFYYVLKLISETQAWQLLKGLIAFVVMMLVASWAGFNTINYIIVNSASVLAIGLIIIFQPELRKALENIGRRSSTFFSANDEDRDESEVKKNVESIVVACEEMAAEYTGALMLIERTTRLGDLIEPGAVVMDAELTSTMLRQIFYHNSPMHDGAVIISGGRIHASRVHVPLGESYNLRSELGTRHRAAIGASEIGDTISIAVSEERGTISLAVYGRLYQLEDADALRTILNRLMNLGVEKSTSSLPRTLRKILRFEKTEREIQAFEDSDGTKETLSEIDAIEGAESVETRMSNREITRRPHRSTAGIFAMSLLAAISLWFYVRVTTNPVVQESYTIPIQTLGVENLNELQLDYQASDYEVRVTIRGRQLMLNSLNSNDIDAFINLGSITETGVYNLPTEVTLDGVSDSAYTVVVRLPNIVTISVYQDTSGSYDDESTDRQTVDDFIEDDDQPEE